MCESEYNLETPQKGSAFVFVVFDGLRWIPTFRDFVKGIVLGHGCGLVHFIEIDLPRLGICDLHTPGRGVYEGGGSRFHKPLPPPWYL